MIENRMSPQGMKELLVGHTVVGLMPGQGELRPKRDLLFLADYPDTDYMQFLFQRANNIFHHLHRNQSSDFDFLNILKDDPQQLSQTEIAQPFLVLLSLLSKHQWENRGGKIDFLAGHSAGEYSALAENCLDVNSALKVIIARGEITRSEIQRSITLGEPQTALYALVRVKPIDLEEVFTVCSKMGINPPMTHDPSQNEDAGYALINGPNDVVMWSKLQKYPLLEMTLKSMGIMGIKLNIPTAFHANTPTMQRIHTRMKQVLCSLEWKDPVVPIIMNSTAEVAHKKNAVIQALLDSHTHMVNWWASMQTMKREGVDTAIQMGPGRFLTHQIGKVMPEVKTVL